MRIRIAVVVMLVFLSMNGNAVSLNGFIYEKGIAVFHIKENYFDRSISSKKSSLLSVDFNNMTVKKIDERRYFSDVSVNFSLNLMLYSNDDEYVVYDMAKGAEFKHINLRASRLYLDDQVFSISGRDLNRKSLILYRPNEDIESTYPLEKKVFWGSAWNSVCQCVEFEISDSWSDPHYVVREGDGGLMKVSKKSYVRGGPKEVSAYFYHEGADDEYIQFKISNKSSDASYYSSGSSEKKYFLWGDRTLRILGMSVLINLETLRLINKTPYMWSDNIPVDDKSVDLASDINGYVLKWNKGSLLFEVEDINTGKTIKTYKKFW